MKLLFVTLIGAFCHKLKLAKLPLHSFISPKICQCMKFSSNFHKMVWLPKMLQSLSRYFIFSGRKHFFWTKTYARKVTIRKLNVTDLTSCRAMSFSQSLKERPIAGTAYLNTSSIPVDTIPSMEVEMVQVRGSVKYRRVHIISFFWEKNWFHLIWFDLHKIRVQDIWKNSGTPRLPLYIRTNNKAFISTTWQRNQDHWIFELFKSSVRGLKDATKRCRQFDLPVKGLMDLMSDGY